MRIRRTILGTVLSMGLVAGAFAQATQPASVPLGPPFRSVAAGISIAAPLGMNPVRGAVGSSEVVRFADEKRKWVLKVSRVMLEPDKPLPLTGFSDSRGQKFPGMLEMTADQFLSDIPGSQELRRETVMLRDREIGMQAAKFNFGLETNITQQAIIPTTRTNQIEYFIVAMTSAAPRDGDLEADPNVISAVTTFTKVVDSVELLDQTEILKDRDERLGSTRLLYLNLTELKQREVLRPGQWLRMMRDGKDVGFMYVVEEIARDLPRKGPPDPKPGPEGVLVGIRSRITADDGGRIDSESWSFSTFDRKYEAFSTTTYADSPRTGKTIGGDVGFSRWRERPIAVQSGIGLGRPEVDLTTEYKLEVTKLGRSAAPEPIVRELPPFYLPQAVGHILPRVMDLRRPDKFLFAAWVPDAGQVMYRYIDILPETDANLGGRRVRAVPVKDRIGLEGPATLHYFGANREYLGSVNEETRTTVLVTDAETLQRAWQDANLTRPGAVER